MPWLQIQSETVERLQVKRLAVEIKTYFEAPAVNTV